MNGSEWRPWLPLGYNWVRRLGRYVQFFSQKQPRQHLLTQLKIISKIVKQKPKTKQVRVKSNPACKRVTKKEMINPTTTSWGERTFWQLVITHKITAPKKGMSSTYIRGLQLLQKQHDWTRDTIALAKSFVNDFPLATWHALLSALSIRKAKQALSHIEAFFLLICSKRHTLAKVVQGNSVPFPNRDAHTQKRLTQLMLSALQQISKLTKMFCSAIKTVIWIFTSMSDFETADPLWVIPFPRPFRRCPDKSLAHCHSNSLFM